MLERVVNPFRTSVGFKNKRHTRVIVSFRFTTQKERNMTSISNCSQDELPQPSQGELEQQARPPPCAEPAERPSQVRQRATAQRGHVMKIHKTKAETNPKGLAETWPFSCAVSVAAVDQITPGAAVHGGKSPKALGRRGGGLSTELC